ncbi:MAG: DNA-directed RNA polymerase subunit RpoH/Rpb5 C-terminal domain-containing protein [Pseudomonadota bacterium]
MAATQAYPPNVIVRTLIDHFFRYRGLAPAPPGLADEKPVADFTDDRIIGDMERFFYVRVDARVDPRRRALRGARAWVVILVLAADGKYSHHSPDLRKLLEGVEVEQAARAGRLDELIIVADEVFFSRKNLTDVVREFQAGAAAARQAARARGPLSLLLDANGAAPFYSAHHFHNFVLVIPEHAAVPAHRIMAPAECDALYATERLTRDDLPTIYASDPAAIWIGARAGEVVEIVRYSATAGRAVTYRRVERGAL